MCHFFQQTPSSISLSRGFDQLTELGRLNSKRGALSLKKESGRTVELNLEGRNHFLKLKEHPLSRRKV